MPDLLEVLDAVDRVAAASVGLVAESSSARAAARAGELRSRRGFQGQTLVFALAGGTGTGKSSLLNALAEAPVASVSAIRPHTDRPLAWIPTARGPALDDLLGSLGITEVATQSHRPGLALLDLPDMDSVAAWHRRTVEKLIPAVDGVLWVFDPVKYRDPTLHDGFLEPLSEYRDHFTFVLNKIDLMGGEARRSVGDDFRRALVDAGYDDPVTFLTSAAPGMGAPEGISALHTYLESRIAIKRVAVRKWMIDLGRELRRIADDAGLWKGASLDLPGRWRRDRDAAVAGIRPGKGSGSRSDAVCRLEDLIAMIAVEVGPRAGDPIRTRFPEGSIETVIDRAASAAEAAGRATKRKRRSAEAAASAAIGVLDRGIGWPLQRLFDGRARLGALLAEAGVALTRAKEDLDRDEGVVGAGISRP